MNESTGYGQVSSRGLNDDGYNIYIACYHAIEVTLQSGVKGKNKVVFYFINTQSKFKSLAYDSIEIEYAGEEWDIPKADGHLFFVNHNGIYNMPSSFDKANRSKDKMMYKLEDIILEGGDLESHGYKVVNGWLFDMKELDSVEEYAWILHSVEKQLSQVGKKPLYASEDDIAYAYVIKEFGLKFALMQDYSKLKKYSLRKVIEICEAAEVLNCTLAQAAEMVD